MPNLLCRVLLITEIIIFIIIKLQYFKQTFILKLVKYTSPNNIYPLMYICTMVTGYKKANKARHIVNGKCNSRIL